jgi:hypothetical protein
MIHDIMTGLAVRAAAQVRLPYAVASQLVWGGWLCVVLILLISRWPCAAMELDALAPPELPNIDDLRPTLRVSPVSNVLLGTLVIKFESTTLDDILDAAGAGEINHRGDAGDSQSWICYTLPFGDEAERVWFSSGELGGPDNQIDSFYASKADKGESSTSCPELPVRLRPASLSRGPWLGARSDLLDRRLGKPSATMNGWRFYSYTGPKKGVSIDPATGKSTKKEFEQLGILGVHIRDGKIVGLFESQITTD